MNAKYKMIKVYCLLASPFNLPKLIEKFLEPLREVNFMLFTSSSCWLPRRGRELGSLGRLQGQQELVGPQREKVADMQSPCHSYFNETPRNRSGCVFGLHSFVGLGACSLLACGKCLWILWVRLEKLPVWEWRGNFSVVIPLLINVVHMSLLQRSGVDRTWLGPVY